MAPAHEEVSASGAQANGSVGLSPRQAALAGPGVRGGNSTVKQLATEPSYIWLTWLNDVIFTLAALALVYLTANVTTLVAVSVIGVSRLALLARERGLAATAAAREAQTEEGAALEPPGEEVTEEEAEEDGDATPSSPPPLYEINAARLNGVWRKDREASEPMDAAMNLVRLNPLVRRAVGLVNGLELEITDTEFHMAVLCAIPWFKVRPGEARHADCAPDLLLLQSNRTSKEQGNQRARWNAVQGG